MATVVFCLRTSASYKCDNTTAFIIAEAHCLLLFSPHLFTVYLLSLFSRVGEEWGAISVGTGDSPSYHFRAGEAALQSADQTRDQPQGKSEAGQEGTTGQWERMFGDQGEMLPFYGLQGETGRYWNCWSLSFLSGLLPLFL